MNSYDRARGCHSTFSLNHCINHCNWGITKSWCRWSPVRVSQLHYCSSYTYTISGNSVRSRWFCVLGLQYLTVCLKTGWLSDEVSTSSSEESRKQLVLPLPIWTELYGYTYKDRTILKFSPRMVWIKPSITHAALVGVLLLCLCIRFFWAQDPHIV